MKKQLLIMSMMASVMAVQAGDADAGAGRLPGVPDVIKTLRPEDMAAVGRFNNFLCGTSRDGIENHRELAVQCAGADQGTLHFYMGRYCLEIIKGMEAERNFRATPVAIQNRRLTLVCVVMAAWAVGREVVPRAYGWYVQRGASR